MKKKFLRVIALVLAICAMQVAFVPSVVAADESVVYNFYSDYKGKGYTHLYKNADTGSAIAKAAVTAAYPNSCNWKIEDHSGYASIGGYYLDIGIGKASTNFVPFRLLAPRKTGNYTVKLNYYTYNTNAAKSAKLYLFEATQDAYTQAEINELVSVSNPLTTIDFYSLFRMSKSISVTYPFVEGREYLFVLQSSENSGTSSTSRMFINNLTLTYKSAYTPDTAMPQSAFVQGSVAYIWEDGIYSAITKNAEGHDYLVLPAYGGKLYVYDLDEMRLADLVDTGIQAARGATVDKKGNVWITGDVQYLYKYDPKTHTGSRTQTYTGLNGILTSGSAFDITLCEDDNCLYFGTYSKAQIIRYDIDNNTFSRVNFETPSNVIDAAKGFTYASGVVKKGDYLYASLLGADANQTNYLVKFAVPTDPVNGTYTPVVCKSVEDRMGGQRYLQGLSFLDENILVGTNTGKMFAVDVAGDKLEFLDEDYFGYSFSVEGNLSEVKGNKVYFSTYEHGHCYYEMGKQDGEQKIFSLNEQYNQKPTSIPEVHTNSGCFVTLNVKDGKVVPQGEDGEVKECMIVRNGNSKQGLKAVDVNEKVTYQLNLVPTDAGDGVGLHAVAAGLPGSNEVYIGSFKSDQVYVYNTQTQKITHSLTAAGMQTDALHWFNGKLYTGNYTLGQLTEIDTKTKTSKALTTLNNVVFPGTKVEIFDQARVHTITSGTLDGHNLVFFGTVPDQNKTGGMIAWHDLKTGISYAAIGPNPEDVYYSPDNKTWYHDEAFQEPITADDVSSIKDDYNAIPGVINKHSITTLVYYDGILFGTSSKQGGTTSSQQPKGGNAELFAYDVKARKVIAHDELGSIFGSIKLNYVGGIAADPKVPGKFWGVANEVLFSFTFNRSTNKFVLQEELAFNDKKEAASDGGRYLFPRPILFAEENGVDYIYVAFSENGNLCKINKANTKRYQKLLPEGAFIPMYYALGENGVLYYSNDADLYALNVNPTEEEWTKAQAVDAQISSLTGTNTAEIERVYAEFGALTDREKSLVQNVAALNNQAVATAIAKINAIGTVTAASSPAIEEARSFYDGLDWAQASRVNNYFLLLDAEYTYEHLRIADVVKEDGTVLRCKSLEEAIATAVAGDTIRLFTDVTVESELQIPANITLDLYGYTLTVPVIDACVKDSTDGNGLIKIAKNTDQKQTAVLSAAEDQLILWDNTSGASGYRIFKYTFTNMGMDVNGDDVSLSEENGVTMKSYWSDLTFKNAYAYTLLAAEAAYSDLTIGFEVSWTPVDGTKTSKSFTLDSSIIAQWAKDEDGNTEKNYCFYIGLTGFDALRTDGMVEVRPFVKTAFNEAGNTVTEYFYEAKSALEYLEFVYGFGDLLTVKLG